MHERVCGYFRVYFVADANFYKLIFLPVPLCSRMTERTLTQISDLPISSHRIFLDHNFMGIPVKKRDTVAIYPRFLKGEI